MRILIGLLAIFLLCGTAEADRITVTKDSAGTMSGVTKCVTSGGVTVWEVTASGVSIYADIWSNLPEGSTSQKGIVELATDTETQALSAATVVVTPSNLGALDASTTQRGIIELATDAESQALSNGSVVVTPSNLGALDASTSQKGILELATDAETQALSATTPAITPSNLAALDASTTQRGIIELATRAEMVAGTATDKVITPNSFVGPVPVRQTALTGPVDASGRADFLTAGTGLEVDTQNLDTTTLRVTFGDGFGEKGEANYTANIGSNLNWSGLTDADVNYLYIDLDLSDDSITTGATTGQPEYSYTKPAAPSTGQYWYPVDHRSRGEYYDGAEWQPVLRLFVGEGEAVAGSISSVTSYAYQGKARSGIRDIDSNPHTENFSANIGTELVSVNYMLRKDSTKPWLYSHGRLNHGTSDARWIGLSRGILDRKTVGVAFYNDEDTRIIGAPDYGYSANHNIPAEVIIIVERAF